MPLLNSLATPYADALLQVTDSREESEEVSA
jgi:F-type H+-transporting ATPase subunit delta